MTYLNKKSSMVLTVSIILVGLLVLLGTSQDKQVAYPEGYRGWTHVKSMVLQEGHALYQIFGGIHHVYANDAALKAMKSGGKYSDGAVLVFDLMEANTENNAIVEGSRKVVGVMERNSTKFAATGGWGYQGFKGDTRERVVTDASAQCYACHLSQKDNEFVFSKYRQ